MIRFIYALAVILGLCAVAHGQDYYWGGWAQPNGVRHVSHHTKHHHKHIHGGYRHRVAHVAPLPTSAPPVLADDTVTTQETPITTTSEASALTSVNQTVVEPVRTPIKVLKKERHMETVVSYLPQAFALLGVLVAAYWVFSKIVGPVATKGLSFVTVLKSDFAAVEARVSALEVSVGLKAAAPAVAPVTPAPASSKTA